MSTINNRIDVHHHILPPDYVKAAEKAGIAAKSFPEWTPQRSIEVLDSNGIATAHILFGSNFAWTPEPATLDLIKELEAYDGFDEQALEEIERRSALDLFPRFKGQ